MQFRQIAHNYSDLERDDWKKSIYNYINNYRKHMSYSMCQYQEKML